LIIVATHFEFLSSYKIRIEKGVCHLVSSNIIMPSFFGNSTKSLSQKYRHDVFI
jgi:hypothetical protein